jgi:hypothetical protein
MSTQNAPLPEPANLFLEPNVSREPDMSREPDISREPNVLLEPDAAPKPLAHHPQPEPAAHLCSCGKVREACVHDEVRAFWSAVSDRAT